MENCSVEKRACIAATASHVQQQDEEHGKPPVAPLLSYKKTKHFFRQTEELLFQLVVSYWPAIDSPLYIAFN